MTRASLFFFVTMYWLSGCSEDEGIKATIIGTWAGDKSDFRVNPSGLLPPFRVAEDDFHVHLRFKADGTVILTDDRYGISKTGTYTFQGNQLTLDIDYAFEYMDLTGTYTIELLTPTELRAGATREGTFSHPDSGITFDGEVDATLYFTKESD